MKNPQTAFESVEAWAKSIREFEEPGRCPRACRIPKRTVSAESAAAWYEKLRPFLAVRESFGCYTPRRGTAKTGDHSSWPLHDWRGPGDFPLIVEWSPSPGPDVIRPTFSQFLRVYGLRVAT